MNVYAPLLDQPIYIWQNSQKSLSQTFTYWGDGEPGLLADNNTAIAIQRSLSWRWNIDSQDEVKAFVCEKDQIDRLQ